MIKFVGHKAASDLLGRPLEPFDPEPSLTCLNLGSAGAVAAADWDREVRLTGKSAKGLTKAICESCIYLTRRDADTAQRVHQAELAQLRETRRLAAVEPDFSHVEAPANMMDPNFTIQAFQIGHR